ncbi:hypothetical protein FHS82_001095 [Pseudochelatococcus lubricantis]|uniref:Uncharacterized protein n=1 Tax=Pseudochelatococcus lubricantis TaxID=1538102 RepID=A0ABX0UYA3_9HYPH|nr:hypothetical protein [Pseudochelatococcus lubricantis]NIJ57269.1 hypothetical protein [Pseudochelatococcus lubricantis]
MTDYVCIYIQRPTGTEHGGIVGRAATEDGALRVAEARGYAPTGDVRWYDGVEGPVRAGYPAYGAGVFIVDVTANAEAV